MKRLRILAAALLIFSVSASLQAQFRSVRGNHDVVKEDRKAGNFTGLKVSSGVDVILRQGNDESVTVEADENLLEYIVTEVKGDVLNVYVDNVNIRDAERMRAYVTMKEINSVKTTSAGDVTGETPIEADRLSLSASSAGNIKLEVTAKEIEIDISSSGDITVTGKADFLDGHLSSAGDLNAYELEVREADTSASSAGDANINVTERITARASSAGDISYRGNPKYINAHSSSAGGIHRR
jgi:hypothetical protein